VEKLILIVDDATAAAAVLRDAVLELAGTMDPSPAVRVEIAASGEELLQRCASQCPDLVVLDVNLPDLDGIDCFYRLRAQWPEVASHTVFLTGYAGSSEITPRLQQALADGARAVFRKPLRLADIEKLLHRHLR